MATRKKPAKAEVLRLPGVPDDVVSVGRSTYRIEAGSVEQKLVDAVLAGRADLDSFSQERFAALMRVLVTLRLRAFNLPFDVYDGNTCSVVRKKLRAIRPSEMARAIIGAGRDPYWSTKRPTIASILQRAPELQVLADDAAPPPPRAKVNVVADYVRLYTVAYELDWMQRWPDLYDVERHTVPILELHLAAMRKVIETSKKMTAEQKRAVLGV